jgi:hypothetical protein
MEHIEQDNAMLREEMDGMREKMDQIPGFIQAMANKERNPQPVVNETNTTWPPYGLPPNYTPPTEGGGPTQPPLVTITIPIANGNPPLQEASASQNENVLPHHASEGTPLVGSVPNSTTPATLHPEDESAQKYQALEERLKAIEGFSAFGIDALEMCLVPDVVVPPKFKTPAFGIDALEMCLVPDVVVPPKFKTPDFEKYKGLQCPKSHGTHRTRQCYAKGRNGQNEREKGSNPGVHTSHGQ